MSTPPTVQDLVIAYLGGRGSLWGPAAIAFPMIFITEWLGANLDRFPGVELVIYGIVLILVMVYYPGGFAALVSVLRVQCLTVGVGRVGADEARMSGR